MVNKQLFIALGCAGIILAAPHGYADDGPFRVDDNWYINVNTTETSAEEHFLNDLAYIPESSSQKYFQDNDTAVSVSFGYQISGDHNAASGTKVETEFLWHEDLAMHGQTAGRHVTAGMMANLLYDFNTGNAFTPYFGIGAGAANVNDKGLGSRGEVISSNSTVPAYQTMAGVSYISPLRPYTSVTLGYRYFSTIAPVAGYTSHNLDAGLSITF